MRARNTLFAQLFRQIRQMPRSAAQFRSCRESATPAIGSITHREIGLANEMLFAYGLPWRGFSTTERTNERLTDCGWLSRRERRVSEFNDPTQAGRCANTNKRGASGIHDSGGDVEFFSRAEHGNFAVRINQRFLPLRRLIMPKKAPSLFAFNLSLPHHD